MTKIKAAITGIHCHLPEHRLTNKELETMVDTNDEWILSRTGINERRILKGKDQGISELAIPAVKGLLEKTGTDPAEIGLLIMATVTSDMQFPATANIVSHACGLTNAFSYDLNAACSGFLYSLTTASKFIETGTHSKVIVVGGDKMSSIIDYTDRTTCIIFGDAAGAVMLEANDEGNGIRDSIMKSDGSGAVHLHQKAGGSRRPASHETVDAKEHYVYQEGQAVFKFAVTRMAEVSEQIMEQAAIHMRGNTQHYN
jgi:3-oxoacyl-[acyl-carrier-protein] synthase-3